MDRSAVIMDDVFRNHISEPGSAILRFVEGLSQRPDLLWRHADTIILDDDMDIAVALLNGQRDRSSLIHRLHGVLQQIDEYLLQLIRFAVNVYRLGRETRDDLDIVQRSLDLHQGNDLFDDAEHVKWLADMGGFRLG